MPVNFDLQPLHGGIDKAHRAAGGAFLGHHIPRLQRGAQLQLDISYWTEPTFGKRNSQCGLNHSASN
jgi:hypothetical protein